MKRKFVSSYKKIVDKAKKNKDCKIKEYKFYSFIKCQDDAYFVENNNGTGLGYLLETNTEKDLIKKIYKLFNPEKIQIVLDKDSK